jgi:glycosyltransferase involved in cell wall biosynthesis
VVAAAAGGLREIVRDGVDGLFYPPGDVDALVAQLSSLLDDPSRLGRFAEAAREGSVRFEPDRNDGIVAGVLDRVVCTHRTARRGTAR